MFTHFVVHKKHVVHSNAVTILAQLVHYDDEEVLYYGENIYGMTACIL